MNTVLTMHADGQQRRNNGTVPLIRAKECHKLCQLVKRFGRRVYHSGDGFCLGDMKSGTVAQNYAADTVYKASIFFLLRL